MPDFTHGLYKEILGALKDSGYSFHQFRDIHGLGEIFGPRALLRHDVDRFPSCALSLAKLESAMGIRSTYYFRTKRCSFKHSIISDIATMGHEIGYHYENFSDCRGDSAAAWKSFRENLALFDRFGGVKSIAMHGSPMSKYDNRDLWNSHDYKVLGVLVEAYLDIDWTRFLYFTDTGRNWCGESNLGDKPNGVEVVSGVKTTKDLSEFIRSCGGRPLIISAHPERWTDNPISHIRAFAFDHAANIIKRMVGR